MMYTRACALVLLLACPAPAFRVRPHRKPGNGWAHHRRQELGSGKVTDSLAETKASRGDSQQQQQQHKVDSTETLYIMGYGSLMKESSRIRTTCGVKLSANQISALSNLLSHEALEAEKGDCFEEVKSSNMILVHAKGIRRGWYKGGGVAATSGGSVEPEGWHTQGLDVSPTYLGALQDDAASMYAVVYKVSQHELDQTDIREGGYLHLWMDPAKVTRLDGGSFEENAKVRWYANPPDSVKTPTQQTPICQSYVDLWLSGALELQRLNNVPGYVENVVDTTYGWSASWVNDRPTPYRAFTREPDARSVAKELLAVAKKTTSIVSEDKTVQPLTIDILSSIRFPGLQLAGLNSRASTPWKSDVVIMLAVLIGLGSLG